MTIRCQERRGAWQIKDKVKTMMYKGRWHFKAKPMTTYKALKAKESVPMGGQQKHYHIKNGKLVHTTLNLLGPLES